MLGFKVPLGLPSGSHRGSIPRCPKKPDRLADHVGLELVRVEAQGACHLTPQSGPCLLWGQRGGSVRGRFEFRLERLELGGIVGQPGGFLCRSPAVRPDFRKTWLPRGITTRVLEAALSVAQPTPARQMVHFVLWSVSAPHPSQWWK